MAKADKIYHDLLSRILKFGDKKPGARPGMPSTFSSFAEQIRFDLRDGFPLLTTKKVSFKNIKTELLYFLRGDCNISYLRENDCHIWDDDVYRYFIDSISKRLDNASQRDKLNMKAYYPNDYANDTPFDYTPISKEEFFKLLDSSDEELGWESSALIFKETYGNLFLGYPHQWRSFGEIPFDTEGIDQIKNVLTSLKTNPFGRRHIVTAWNPAEVDLMTLPCCHAFIQFNVSQDDTTREIFLDCALTMRSNDVFLGNPYNTASYALMTEIFAKILGYKARYLSIVMNDCHIYDSHIDAVNELLSRDVNAFNAPQLLLDGSFGYVNKFWEQRNTVFNIDAFLKSELEIEIENYQSFKAIKAKLSVGL